MSKDIRSYFMAKSSKPKVSAVSPDVGEKATKKRKNVIFDSSDSDSEDFVSIKKKSKTKSNSPAKKKSEVPERKKPALIPVNNVSEVLGSKPAKRSLLSTLPTEEKKPEVKKNKKTEQSKAVKPRSLEEAEVHSDSDLEATLEQLDFDALDKIEQAALSTDNGAKPEAKPQESVSPPKNSKSKYFAENATEKILADFKAMQAKKDKNVPKSPENIPKSCEKVPKSSDKVPKSSEKVDTTCGSSVERTASAGKTDTEIIEGTPDPLEKRKQHAQAYRKFLSRGGPAHPHSKDIPEGALNCLQGLVFVVTGVLDSLDREETEELIKKYAGKVTHSLSKNTSFLIAGNEPGPSKMDKASKLGTAVLDEDGLLEMIRTRQAFAAMPSPAADKTKKHSTSDSTPEPSKKHRASASIPQRASNVTPEPGKKHHTSDSTPEPSKKHHAPCTPESSQKVKVSPEDKRKTLQTSPQIKKGSQSGSQSSQSPASSSQQTLPVSPELRDGSSSMWVDKYKPTSIKNIIGQQGDRSPAKKLLLWLTHWAKNNLNTSVKKPKPSPWAKNDDGAAFKAALLSGPPGIGKTTTVQLVCKELGLDVVEFNASDTRSKKLLHDEVKELLSTRTLFNLGPKGSDGTTIQRALLMEEVDGIAGNQDRGGIQELIQLIKSSKVPIICTCNDRNAQKIRSLVNYCFDLRFSKPRTEQIKAAMMSVCFKEGVKIPGDALNAMIEGSNHDIRQVMHHLSLWSAGESNMAADMMKREAAKSRKEFKLGPWDVTRKVFSEEEQKEMTLNDKASLFFHDYSLGPLFVQENYLNVTPHIKATGKEAMKQRLRLMADAADSIALGDLVDNKLRTYNAWALLPTQAIFASVVPGALLRGHMSAQIRFPGWLGKNSRRNKFDRLYSELQMHMRLSISGSKEAVALDYLQPVRNKVMTAILERGQDGIPEALDTMQEYHLLREDLESMSELAAWGNGAPDPWTRVESKVKAAFTRAYNKSPMMTPYSMSGGVSKGRGKGVSSEELRLGEEEEEEGEAASESEEEDDLKNDVMIKAKKPAVTEKPGRGKTSGASTSSSRGGRGKGKVKK